MQQRDLGIPADQNGSSVWHKFIRKPISNQLVLEPNAVEIKDESAIDYEQGRAS